MTTDHTELETAFRESFDTEPDGLWFAPGRVNLLGEHTDYNGGLVLPMAITLGTFAAVRLREDDVVRLRSLQPGTDPVDTTLGEIDGGLGWAAYPAGVLWAAARDGLPVRGLDVLFDADLPMSSGLSSSASISCAAAQAASDLLGWGLAPDRIARLARVSENEVVGSPTGIMDQLAAACGEDGFALRIDTATEVITRVPFPLEQFSLELLVIDSHTPHDNLAGEYGDRRRACERAAEVLGVEHLAQVAESDLAPLEAVDPMLLRRARHIVTDSARVDHATAILQRSGDPREIGPLLDASHVSMRDDFEITAPTVDLIQQTARASGAYGARMTGGGFGGCVIAIIEQGSGEDILSACRTAAERAGFPEPTAFVALPAQGARRLR